MNTEKLEKLKKSLDNKFIPDNVKDKIRAEIKKLEADIKTDETITTTEIKSEVKEIEKEVEKALEVAEKKEEKAEAKTRAKRTTTSRTKKPKVEEKPKTKKKTVFSLAKEIRKADESWDDAKLRARKMMTSQTTETKAKARTETDKLLAMVRRNKEYKKLAGTSNLSKDAQRRAMPRGKRVSKTGNVYYENRANRVDVGGFKSAYLETGGRVGKMKKSTLKKGDVVLVVGRRWFDRANGNTYHTAEVFVNDKYVGKSRMTYGYDEQYIQTAKEILLDSYELPKGMRDTSPLWQLREYGVTLNKTVSDGLKRDLETGGTIIGTPETPLGRDLGISYTGLVGETGAMSSGEMFTYGGGVDKNFEIELFWKGLSGNERKIGKYVVAEKTLDNLEEQWGHILSIDVIDETNREPISWYDIKRELFSIGREKNLFEQGGSLVDGYLTDPNFGDFQSGVYEMGGNTGLPAGTEQHFVNYYLGEGTAQGIYAKGGGVRMVGGREYPTGRNWTNEHRHIDKADEREVNYVRKKSFADGGGVDYVPQRIQERLEYLRGEIRKEDISYDEIVELESLREYIAPDDVELLQWVDVEEDEFAKGGKVSPFKNIMETNTITEKEINLIKLRMNNNKVDEDTQEIIDYIWDNSPQLTPDQNRKGIDYLRNLWKSPTGKERANNPFGYREQEALETFEYFELRGFYDAGNRYRKFYVPLYICVGAETSFEYYISGGGINIVG